MTNTNRHCEGSTRVSARGNLNRILSIILAAILLLSVLPLTVSAADADTVATGSGALRIVRQPPENTYYYVSSTYIPFYSDAKLDVAVKGGSGQYSFTWYFREYEGGGNTKVASGAYDTAYSTHTPGYYFCEIKDTIKGDVVTSDFAYVSLHEQNGVAAPSKVRLNGTKLEWSAADEYEKNHNEAEYKLDIIRYDKTHNRKERLDSNFYICVNTSDHSVSVMHRYGDNSNPFTDWTESYPTAYNAENQSYSMDFERDDLIGIDRNYTDIEYSFRVYLTSNSKIESEFVPCYDFYHGYVSSVEHSGDVQIIGDDFVVGNKITANINGGFWSGTDKRLIYTWQRKNNSEWEDITSSTGNEYILTKADANKYIRVVVKPDFNDRFRGEMFFDSEVFVSDSENVADNTCTISFTPNGGTGAMEPVKVEKGSSYTLPACTFTPPEGKVFDKWAVNGTISFGNVTQITVNEDTVLSAQWKNAASGTYSITGTTESFLEESDNTSIILSKKSGDNYALQGIRTVSGNSGTYGFTGLSNGQYKLSVRKKNHVTREYNVTILLGSKTQDVVICPIGDINGDGNVSTVDYGMANSHARNKVKITDPYKFDCGNVAGDDDKITTVDAGRINSHARNKVSLWK